MNGIYKRNLIKGKIIFSNQQSHQVPNYCVFDGNISTDFVSEQYLF